MNELICLLNGHTWVSHPNPWHRKGYFRFNCYVCKDFCFVENGCGVPEKSRKIFRGGIAKGIGGYRETRPGLR